MVGQLGPVICHCQMLVGVWRQTTRKNYHVVVYVGELADGDVAQTLLKGSLEGEKGLESSIAPQKNKTQICSSSLYL